MSQPTPSPYDPSTPAGQPGQADPYGQGAGYGQSTPYGQSAPGYDQGAGYGPSTPYGQSPSYNQGGYGQPQPGQYGNPYPVSRPNNSMALVSLIAGIAGLTIIPGIGSIVAVITGHMAKREIARTGEDGSGLATGGLIMGWIGVGLIILAIIGAILFFAFFAAVGSTSTTGWD